MKIFHVESLVNRLMMVWIVIIPLILLTGFNENKDEYTVKALFVYNFTKYIEWPEQNIRQQFKIRVFGESVITEKLSVIFKGKKLYNLPVEVKEINNINEVAGCQILFIPKNSSNKLKLLLDRFSQTETLIVTEDKNMAAKGAGINIIEKDQRIKFEINNNAIKKAGLKVAYQLYELAIIVP